MIIPEGIAQKNKKVKISFTPPPIIECVIKKPANFKGILYQFPGNIRKIVDSALQKNRNSFSYIDLSVDDKYITLMMTNFDSKPDFTSEIGDWIYNTNRYYQFQSKFIPIILDCDRLFSDQRVFVTGDGLYLKYEKRGWCDDYAKIIKEE
jgi:hypothetical protein